ncbi:Bromodomain-containing protein [Ochromonadaceae sp. CCMP2298]|nr:Bromodomain-containing protein [Ochromonadaceae sp. CCMP2298]
MQEYQDRSTPKAPTPRVASKSAPPAPPAPREKEPKERGPRLSAPMKRCSEVLRELAKQPQGVWFLEPVDYVKMGIPDYPRVIKRPMDLGLVGSNVESGVYEGCEGFAEDVRQVFRNALLFNTDKVNPVNIAARELAARFEDRYRLLTAQLGLAPAPEAAKRGRPSLGGKKAKSPRSLKVARTGLGPRASSAPALSAGGAMDGNMQILEMQRMMDEMRQEISSLRSAVRVEEVPLTFEEKKAVIDAIHRLPPDKMEQVLDIIQAALPPQTDDGEIEVPLDLLDTFTLRKLQQFIVEQKKGGKRPRKGGGAQSAAPPSPSLLGGVGLPEEDLSLFEEGEDMLFAADSFDEPP